MTALKTFEEKITYAVEKIKLLKEEKNNLEKQIEELGNMLKSKNREIDELIVEKASIKTQLEDLFNELESIELK
jgi:chromosome segregation ATPase